MVTTILAILAGLMAALPEILTMIEKGVNAREAKQKGLIDRDESVLADGLDRLRKP